MMRRVKAPLLLAAAWLATAHCAMAAQAVPKPNLRPAQQAAVTPAVPVPKLRPAARPPATAALAIPIPRPRPYDEPDAPPEAAPEASGGWPAAAVAEGRAACKSLLAGRDIAYRPLDPIGDEGGCGVPAPIEVSAVAGVRLVPPATQTCAMAAALFTWVSEDVEAAAKKRLGTEVTEIRTATSYACRRRNNGAAGKMSEHSKANALDMSGFTFAKAAVSVASTDNWGEGLLGALGLSKDNAFLADIRKSACSHFTTVLGPGSDPFHGDHFHVDVLQRKGDYRICQ